uniref:Uncharacterized protein n=1 Tax=Panagrolaimus davidi TaxID=227884 RepID=A0A914QLJ0_9BILA
MEVRFKLPGGGLGGALDVVKKKSTPYSNGIDNFDRRYSNLNLNENYKCSNISSLVQSDSKSKKYDKTFGKQAAVRRDHNKVTVKNTENLVFCSKYTQISIDNIEKRKTLQSKIVEHCSKKLMPASKYDEAEEKVKNLWKKEPSSAISSTLSLHVAGYENSVEVLINTLDENEGFKKKSSVEKWKNVKQIFTDSLQSLIQVTDNHRPFNICKI